MRPKREPATHNQQTYMVTSETWGRRALFRTERWAQLFIDTLYHYRGTGYQLHAFVVMPDHFHVLITPAGSLERAVQYIKGGFSRRAKVELESNMEVWQKGFSDHRIRDLEDYRKHVAYIHLNPVRKQLCESAEDYPYSSAHPGFVLDEVPQRLKPETRAVACGAAEDTPIQSCPSTAKAGSVLAPNGEPEGPLFQSTSTSAPQLAEAARLQSCPSTAEAGVSLALNGGPKGPPLQRKA